MAGYGTTYGTVYPAAAGGGGGGGSGGVAMAVKTITKVNGVLRKIVRTG